MIRVGRFARCDAIREAARDWLPCLPVIPHLDPGRVSFVAPGVAWRASMCGSITQRGNAMRSDPFIPRSMIGDRRRIHMRFAQAIRQRALMPQPAPGRTTAERTVQYSFGFRVSPPAAQPRCARRSPIHGQREDLIVLPGVIRGGTACSWLQLVARSHVVGVSGHGDFGSNLGRFCVSSTRAVHKRRPTGPGPLWSPSRL